MVIFKYVFSFNKMKYVDGYVLVVKKKNFNKYKKMASEGGKIWKKYGVLGYFECDWR